MRFIALLSLLALLSSCGKSDSNAGLPIVRPKQLLPVDGSNIEGLYTARFVTLNESVVGQMPGSATIERKNDKLYAFVKLTNANANGWHMQDIHEGVRCPTPSDDSNGDGIIDVQEGEKVYGKVLVPLDSNISSQGAGRNMYPLSDDTGAYYYERSARFTSLLRDLHDSEKELSDRYVKIPEGMGLELEGKVVVVHGAPEGVSLPESVSTIEDRPSSQTLPIACGVFVRVTDVPPESETSPSTEANPAPHPAPNPSPAPAPSHDADNDDDQWYDRISNWWRRTWNHERGERPLYFSNGR